MANMMAAYRLAVKAGVTLAPAREAPPVPREFVELVAARGAVSGGGFLRRIFRPVRLGGVSPRATAGGIVMYDSTEPSEFPSDAALVASYVDGYGGYDAAVSRFGAAKVVSISVGDNDAMVADVEPGAMSAGELSSWIARQKARGISRPALYSDGSQYSSVWDVGGSSCSYWTANPTGQVVQTLPGRDAVQSVFGNSYDESWVLPSFPWYPGGATPPPPPSKPFYGIPRNLSFDAVSPPTTDYVLTWSVPAPVTGVPAPTEYQVYVYDGQANAAHLAQKETTVTTTTMGVNGLKHGHTYIVHVVAAGVTKYVGKDVFATLIIKP